MTVLITIDIKKLRAEKVQISEGSWAYENHILHQFNSQDHNKSSQHLFAYSYFTLNNTHKTIITVTFKFFFKTQNLQFKLLPN